MSHRLDMKNHRYGRLTVLKRIWWNEGEKNYGKWWCVCDCGNYIMATVRNLRRGSTKSCGCLFLECIKALNRKHGLTGTREHRSWCNVWEQHRKDGTKVDPLWKSYYRFISAVGRCPAGKPILCRRVLSEGFNSDNCFWGIRGDVAQRRKRNYGSRTITVLSPRVDLEVSAGS